MGIPREPIPVKIFIGLLAKSSTLLDCCCRDLETMYGPTDLVSVATKWTHTDYYREEMGPELLRKFIFFKKLFDPSMLIAVKEEALRIEKTLMHMTSNGPSRQVNLDPGYVTEAKVVLCTTKDFSHRIYLGNGIYGEVTLHYERSKNGFVRLAHTYPDFCSEDNRALFLKARSLLRASLHR